MQLKNITSDKNIESLERSLNSVIGEQNRLEERGYKYILSDNYDDIISEVDLLIIGKPTGNQLSELNSIIEKYKHVKNRVIFKGFRIPPVIKSL